MSWEEAALLPRVDHLREVVNPLQTILPVEHPEWFRAADMIRVGTEYAMVISPGKLGLIVQRGFRSMSTHHSAGSHILIVASAMPEQPEEEA